MRGLARIVMWGSVLAVSLIAPPAALGASATGAPASASVSAHGNEVLLPVWALLDKTTPVSGARVSVYAGVPGRLSRRPLSPLRGSKHRTNAAGADTLEFTHLPRTFTVVVRGGKVLGRSLNGSLSAQVHGYDSGISVDGVSAGPVVLVNPVTTLVDGLQGIDHRIGELKAKQIVDRALGIPGFVSDIDLSVDSRWLDGRTFLRSIHAHGTLDRTTGALLAAIHKHKHLASLRPPRTAHTSEVPEWWKQTDIGELVKDGLSALGEGVALGIGSAGGTWVLAKFLDAIGLGAVADIFCPVCALSEKLDAIAAQVAEVKALVLEGIQATAHSQYDTLVSHLSTLDGNISGLWERMNYETKMRGDPTLKKYNANVIANIGTQLVNNGDAVAQINEALAPGAPGAYGIYQAASAYLGTKRPFYTQGSAKVMTAVVDYYKLLQLRVSILLVNYKTTMPDTFSPKTIRENTIDRIAKNIAGQQKLVKPPPPPGTFIDLRTGRNNGALLLWGPVTWVNGNKLEHYCVDQHGSRQRFYAGINPLTCDAPPNDSAKLGDSLATEAQFKALLNGWHDKPAGSTAPLPATPLEWLRNTTGLKMTAATSKTKKSQTGFFWVGRSSTAPNESGPVQGPYCRIVVCNTGITLGFYQYIYRYDMKDTSTPSPNEWISDLWGYDPYNYNANAVVVKPVSAGDYFWPVGG